MIYGIGVDILSIKRIRIVYLKFKLKFTYKILSKDELKKFMDLHDENNQINFLAKRFCVKEAFAKSVHTGLRNPVIFNNISLNNDKLGKPFLTFEKQLQYWIKLQQISKIHVSLSDEEDKILSFVISEKND